MKNVYDFYITPEEYAEAIENGVDERLLNHRVRDLGWDKKRAITKPRRKVKNMERWTKLALKNGIPLSTFRRRYYALHWNVEKAATTPIKNKKEVLKKIANDRRIYPKDMIELAEKNGIKYQTFVARVRNGMDIYEAATKPLTSYSENGKNTAKILKEKGISIGL